VAAIVGPDHTVDLKSYDLLILVEIYKVRPRSASIGTCGISFVSRMTRANTIDLHVQNICGVSVVGSDFDKLKKYNLAEIFEPTPKPAAAPSLSDPEAKEG
jgi:tRNA acetyltransferase TAN1